MNENKKSYGYSHTVIHAIREWYMWNQNTYLTTQEVKELEPKLVLELYLEWEGIYGYTHTILSILEANEE